MRYKGERGEENRKERRGEGKGWKEGGVDEKEIEQEVQGRRGEGGGVGREQEV
jgi:hypothetical protein